MNAKNYQVANQQRVSWEVSDKNGMIPFSLKDYF